MKKVINKSIIDETLSTLEPMLARALQYNGMTDEITIPKFYVNFCTSLVHKPSMVLKKFTREYTLANLNAKKVEKVSISQFITYLCACDIALKLIRSAGSTDEAINGYTDDLASYANVLTSAVDDFHQIYQTYLYNKICSTCHD